MSELPTTKPELVALRAALIDTTNDRSTSTKERMDAQLKLAEVNAAIKHINLIQAADAKRDADLRKALGCKEQEVNHRRHEERGEREVERQNHGPNQDEEILIKSKMLLRELMRYPAPQPVLYHSVAESLTQLITLQKSRIKGNGKAEEERDSWAQTWTKAK